LVYEPSIIQGRHIALTDLEQVRQLLAAHPDWSRRRLSQHLATLWNLRNPVGQLKDMTARTLLLKLEQRGWIALPPRRQVPSNRMRHKRMLTPQGLVPESPLLADLGTLLPLEISEVSTLAGTRQPSPPERPLWPAPPRRSNSNSPTSLWVRAPLSPPADSTNAASNAPAMPDYENVLTD
jgi:hypothetical protein